jgi:hypothetical protein
MSHWASTNRKRWTDEEHELFLNKLTEYREAIADKSEQEVTEITKRFAEAMREEYPILRERSLRAVYEHLVYFDDLTAGVLTCYTHTDKKWLGVSPRKDRSMERNRAKMPRYYAKYIDRT